MGESFISLDIFRSSFLPEQTSILAFLQVILKLHSIIINWHVSA